MIQLLRLTKSTGKGDIWINPNQVIFAEVVEKKEDKTTMTVLHVAGKEPKLFVKELPGELNKIFAKFGKKQFKIEEI